MAPPCSYFKGIRDYFTLNRETFHPKFSDMQWNGPCVEDINYSVDLRGSLNSYRELLEAAKYRIFLYNGDWDNIVPYLDTKKNIEDLGLRFINRYGFGV